MTDFAPKPRVVVIDDEQIVADTLAQILKMHGYEARAYYGGETAVAGAKDFRPEVVLSDVQMQPIDGIETAMQIRAFLPECRLILFTASRVRTGIHQKIRELGFELLERPLHPSEVLALLRHDTHWRRASASIACPAAQQRH